jgi:hypothetical protein
MLKGMERGRKRGPFALTAAARDAFKELKQAFIEPPVLRHFNPDKEILIITNASKVAVTGIILQLADVPAGETQPVYLRDYHPVAYFLKKLNQAQRNYDTHDQELLAIVEAFRVWHYYLKESYYPIWIQTDHNNLRYFYTTKILNSR